MTPDQFWASTPREYYALKDVWEMRWERQSQLEGNLLAKLDNMFRKEGDPTPARTWRDYYPGRKQRKELAARNVADPFDPFGTQTVEQKRFMFRSILSEAANTLPEGGVLPPGTPKEMPDWQKAAVELAWADFSNLTGQKPN